MAIVSDSEPAFASEVMQELAKIFGAKHWDFGPVSTPQHHGQIERRVESYNRAIKSAMAAGPATYITHAASTAVIEVHTRI